MPDLKAFVVAILPSIVVGACSTGSDNVRDPIIVRDSAGVTLAYNDVESLNGECMVSESPTLSIGQADGEEPYLFYRVFGSTKLSDGSIAIANQGSQHIRIFDADGEFQRAIGGEGGGPGEFQSMFYLWRLPGDVLWIGDYRPWEFEVYNSDGSFIKQVRPRPQYNNPPERMGVLDDGRAILAEVTSQRGGFEVLNLAFMLHDATGELVDTLFALPNGRWGQIDAVPNSPLLYPVLESFAEFDVRGEKMVAGVGDKPELTVRSAESGFAPSIILRWEAGDQTISRDDIEAAFDRRRERYADLTDEQKARYLAPLIHQDRPIAERKPVFTDVQLGVDESVWVKQFSHDVDAATSVWLRFDRSGKFACRATIPNEMEVHEFGSNYVLGELTDENGVERIVEYSIASPSVVNSGI